MSFLSTLKTIVSTFVTPIINPTEEERRKDFEPIDPIIAESSTVKSEKRNRWRPKGSLSVTPKRKTKPVEPRAEIIEVLLEPAPTERSIPEQPITTEPVISESPLATKSIENHQETPQKREITPKAVKSTPKTPEVPKTRKNRVFHPWEKVYQLARIVREEMEPDIFPFKQGVIVKRHKASESGIADSYDVLLDNETKERRFIINNLASLEEYPDGIPPNTKERIAGSWSGRPRPQAIYYRRKEDAMESGLL